MRTFFRLTVPVRLIIHWNCKKKKKKKEEKWNRWIRNGRVEGESSQRPPVYASGLRYDCYGVASDPVVTIHTSTLRRYVHELYINSRAYVCRMCTFPPLRSPYLLSAPYARTNMEPPCGGALNEKRRKNKKRKAERERKEAAESVRSREIADGEKHSGREYTHGIILNLCAGCSS